MSELRRLLEHIRNSEPRQPRAPRIRAVTAESQLGAEGVDGLLARYQAGESAHSIAHDLGISAAGVMRLVRKHGLVIHDPLPSDEVVKLAGELYESGMSLKRVADQVDVPKSTVRKALIASGIAMRPAKNR